MLLDYCDSSWSHFLCTPCRNWQTHKLSRSEATRAARQLWLKQTARLVLVELLSRLNPACFCCCFFRQDKPAKSKKLAVPSRPFFPPRPSSHNPPIRGKRPRPRQVHATAEGTTASSAVVHSTGCGCSKSACLKRYCECFSLGIACSDKCRCRNCKNKTAAGRARTGPDIGAGGGDLGARTVDTMSSTTPRPPTTAVRTSDMSRAGTGDVPDISAKRSRTTVIERRPQDRAGTEVDGAQSSQLPRN